MSSKQRDKLRKATLGAPSVFKSEIVTFNGAKFEIRQPTIKARSNLRSRCTTVKGPSDVDFDMFEFLVWSVIANTYVPGTDDLVFDEADYDALVQNPTGGFMDQFSEVAAELMNVEPDVKKKSSKKAQKDSSSTVSLKL